MDKDLCLGGVATRDVESACISASHNMKTTKSRDLLVPKQAHL